MTQDLALEPIAPANVMKGLLCPEGKPAFPKCIPCQCYVNRQYSWSIRAQLCLGLGGKFVFCRMLHSS